MSYCCNYLYCATEKLRTIPCSKKHAFVLFDDAAVFSDTHFDNKSISDSLTSSIDSMASNAHSTISQADISTVLSVLEKIQGQINNVETRLETLNTLEKKVDNFDRDMKKLWNLVHESNKRLDEKITKIDENFEHLDFRQAEIKSSVEALEQQNLN